MYRVWVWQESPEDEIFIKHWLLASLGFHYWGACHIWVVSAFYRHINLPVANFAPDLKTHHIYAIFSFADSIYDWSHVDLVCFIHKKLSEREIEHQFDDIIDSPVKDEHCETSYTNDYIGSENHNWWTYLTLKWITKQDSHHSPGMYFNDMFDLGVFQHVFGSFPGMPCWKSSFLITAKCSKETFYSWISDKMKEVDSFDSETL